VNLPEIDMGEGNASFVLGSGPVAVLLIHGLTGTPTELRRVAQGLAKRGYTVYVPTLAGHKKLNINVKNKRYKRINENQKLYKTTNNTLTNKINYSK
jgi:esterase/lipase